MAFYQYKTASLSRLIITAKGVLEPLCNNCKSRDCENPIEKQKVSIFGENKEMKIINNRGNISIVIQCDGYNP